MRWRCIFLYIYLKKWILYFFILKEVKILWILFSRLWNNNYIRVFPYHIELKRGWDKWLLWHDEKRISHQMYDSIMAFIIVCCNCLHEQMLLCTFRLCPFHSMESHKKYTEHTNMWIVLYYISYSLRWVSSNPKAQQWNNL